MKISRLLGTVCAFVIGIGTTYSANAATLYASEHSVVGNQLLTIDTSTGAGTVVGTIGFSTVYGLAYDSNNSILYGVDATTDELLTINTTTGVGTAVGSLGFAFVRGLTFDSVSGILYANDEGTEELLTINTTTGAATAVGLTDLFMLGLAFDPGSTLYGVDIQDDFWTVNTVTGGATLVGATGLSVVQDIAFDPISGTLYGTDIGTDELYTINTTTGVATSVGSLGFGNVRGLAFESAAVPLPAALWLFGSGLLGLVGIARRKKT